MRVAFAADHAGAAFKDELLAKLVVVDRDLRGRLVGCECLDRAGDLRELLLGLRRILRARGLQQIGAERRERYYECDLGPWR